MTGHDQGYEQALAKLLTEHLEQGVPDEADVWAAVNERLGQRESVSRGTDKQESHTWWRNVTEVMLGSSALKVEGRPSKRRRPLLAFVMGTVGLALLTLITVVSIGRLAERGRNTDPGPIISSVIGLPTPIKAWSVIVSSDFTDIVPLIIGNPSNGQLVEPFGVIAVGEDGNVWFANNLRAYNAIDEFGTDGTPLKTIKLDAHIATFTMNWQGSFRGMEVQGSNFWLLVGDTVYKVDMNGDVVAEYHPFSTMIAPLAPVDPLPKGLALQASDSGQILIEQTDGTYVKADEDASTDFSKPQSTPLPGYPGGGKFYSSGQAPNEILAGGISVTVDLPGRIYGKRILKVLPDGSFYLQVVAQASNTPNTVDGAYSYVMHYAADGKLVERARLFSPVGAQTTAGQIAVGPGGAFYAVASDVDDPGRVDLVSLTFRPASEALPAVPAVPTTVPTPILPTPIPTIERPQVPSPIPSAAEQVPTIAPTPVAVATEDAAHPTAIMRVLPSVVETGTGVWIGSTPDATQRVDANLSQYLTDLLYSGSATMIAQGMNTTPVPSDVYTYLSLTTYEVQEIDLPQEETWDTIAPGAGGLLEAQTVTFNKAWRVTVKGQGFITANSPWMMYADDKVLGICNPTDEGLATIVYDRSLLSEGTKLGVSLGYGGPAYLAEALHFRSGP